MTGYRDAVEEHASLLGEYLRARRGVLQPEDLGLVPDRARRVSGLRREEVAAAAGVSVDYYVRLEQGRDRAPSDQVIDALAAALRVGDFGLRHMHRLVRLQNRRPAQQVGTTRGAALTLLELWPETPVAVVDANRDVVASNAVAQDLCGLLAPGRNLLMGIFRQRRPQSPAWVEVAERGVADLRFRSNPYDPRLQEIVGQLSIHEPVFRSIWARHDSRPWANGLVHLPDRNGSELRFSFHMLDVPSTDGSSVLAFHAADAAARDAVSRLARRGEHHRSSSAISA